eukprot:5035358-Pyramimonas_sp.AAC.1
MSANRPLSLPALQPPYSPTSVQKTDSTTQDDSNNRITDAPDVFKSIPVITSHAAALLPELSPDNQQHLVSDSNNTNSFAILDRAADR